jgi:hydroxyacylglutathione hydrolase
MVDDLEIVPLHAFNDNYIWLLRRNDSAVVVDPGDEAPVLAYLDKHRLTLSAILVTHHHGDHIGGIDDLLAQYKVPVFGPAAEAIDTVSHPLNDGDRVELPQIGASFDVLSVPGHTRGHIAYYGRKLSGCGVLFCGDTLFACGCGRIFEGTPRQMHDALAKLTALPDRTRVYCGHEYTLSNIRFAKAAEPDNPLLAEWEREATAQRARNEATLPSTIGREKAANPFVRCSEPGVIASASRHAGKALPDAVSVLAEIRDWKNNF